MKQNSKIDREMQRTRKNSTVHLAYTIEMQCAGILPLQADFKRNIIPNSSLNFQSKRTQQIHAHSSRAVCALRYAILTNDPMKNVEMYSHSRDSNDSLKSFNLKIGGAN